MPPSFRPVSRVWVFLIGKFWIQTFEIIKMNPSLFKKVFRRKLVL